MIDTFFRTSLDDLPPGVAGALIEWKIRIDEVFFQGGVGKTEILRAFGAHVFFDYQDVHCNPASKAVSSARVLWRVFARCVSSLINI